MTTALRVAVIETASGDLLRWVDAIVDLSLYGGDPDAAALAVAQASFEFNAGTESVRRDTPSSVVRRGAGTSHSRWTGSDWELVPDLAEAKRRRVRKVDKKTKRLAREGLSAGGQTYRATPERMAYWGQLDSQRADNVVYDLDLETKGGTFTVSGATALHTRVGGIMNAYRALHDSGEAIKVTARAITNDTGAADIPPNYHDPAVAIAAIAAVDDAR